MVVLKQKMADIVAEEPNMEQKGQLPHHIMRYPMAIVVKLVRQVRNVAKHLLPSVKLSGLKTAVTRMEASVAGGRTQVRVVVQQ